MEIYVCLCEMGWLPAGKTITVDASQNGFSEMSSQKWLLNCSTLARSVFDGSELVERLREVLITELLASGTRVRT